MPGMSNQNPDEFDRIMRNGEFAEGFFDMSNRMFEEPAPQPPARPAIDYRKHGDRPSQPRPIREQPPLPHYGHDTAHEDAEHRRLTRENNALLHHLHETLSSVHLPSKPTEPSRLSKSWTRLKNYASSIKSELSEISPFLIGLFWTAVPWIVIEILVLKIFGSHMVFQPNLARYLIGAAALCAIGRCIMAHLLILMERHNFDTTTQTWRSVKSEHVYVSIITGQKACTAMLVMTGIFGTIWFYFNMIALMS